MLIHLVPKGLAGPVTFTLTFPATVERLTLPAAWNAQLQALDMDDLDCPASLLALDVAAGPVLLLDRVLFDVDAGQVVCDFVDGHVQMWSLDADNGAVQLESVLQDVETSKQASQREVLKRARSKTMLLNSPSKQAKHKKSRSAFLNFFTSVFPSTSKQVPDPLLEAEASTSTASSGHDLAPLSPRLLRRRARTTLLDVFRRHVLPEIAKCAHPGGYHAWATQSMLRRADAQISALLAEAAGSLSLSLASSIDGLPPTSDEAALRAQARTALEEGLARIGGSSSSLGSPDDEDGEGELDSDDCPATPELDNDLDTLDGSSIHTPRSSYFSHASSLFRQSSVGGTPPADTDADPSKRPSISSARVSPRAPSAELIARYTALTRQAARLRGLLVRLAEHDAAAKAEREDVLAAFEVKSRRRAWLNKAFVGVGVEVSGLSSSGCGGAGAGGDGDGSGCGGGRVPGMESVYLAMPMQGSPLARRESVTAESLRRVGVVGRSVVGRSGEWDAAWGGSWINYDDEEEEAPRVAFPRVSLGPEDIAMEVPPDDLEAIGGSRPEDTPAPDDASTTDDWDPPARTSSLRAPVPSTPQRVQVRVRPRAHGMRLLERLHLESLVVDDADEADLPIRLSSDLRPITSPASEFPVPAISISEHDDELDVLDDDDDGPFDRALHRSVSPIVFGEDKKGRDGLEVETKVSLAFGDEGDDGPDNGVSVLRKHDEWRSARGIDADGP